MATLDLPEQLAALETVRAELEAALGSDENWRALRRAGAAGGASDSGPDRRDRDARLTKALEANPLYGAWRHLGEAIRALRDAGYAVKAAETRDDLTRIRGVSPALARRLAENGVTRYAKIAAWTREDVSIATEVLALAVGEIERQNWIQQATLLAVRKSDLSAEALPAAGPAAGPEAGPESGDLPDDDAPQELQDEVAEPPAEDVDDAARADTDDADTDELELPESIRELIRADAADVLRFDPPPEPTARPIPPAENAGEPAAATAAEQTARRKLGSKLAAIPSIEPISAPTHLEFSERLHKLEADMDEFDEAIEAPTALAAASDRAPKTEPELKPEPPASASSSGDDMDVSEVPTTQPMAQPVEAKVTFLTREPPAESRTKSHLSLAGGLHNPDRQPAAPGEAFVPPAGALEEAEVTIVKPASAQGGDAGPVRRFLKALSGD